MSWWRRCAWLARRLVYTVRWLLGLPVRTPGEAARALRFRVHTLLSRISTPSAEAVAALFRGVEDFAALRHRQSHALVALRSLNMSHQDLRGVHWQGCILADIDFTGANMAGASFAGAWISRCRFERANLDLFEPGDHGLEVFAGANLGNWARDVVEPAPPVEPPGPPGPPQQPPDGPPVGGDGTRTLVVAAPPVAVLEGYGERLIAVADAEGHTSTYRLRLNHRPRRRYEPDAR
jgi:hypothetical protein